MLYIISIVILCIFAGIFLFFNYWLNWCATREERNMPMAGDDYLVDKARAAVKMTRAVTIHAKAEVVWPWMVQIGRGAGWYTAASFENDNKASARHIVTWIPAPQIGDCTTIGYLRYMLPGREMAWWAEGQPFLKASGRFVSSFRLVSLGAKTRFILRNSGDANGKGARIGLLYYSLFDSIVTPIQMRTIRKYIEQFGMRTVDDECPETGQKDQYQYFEVIYASGESAGVQGKENAALYRDNARKDGVLKS